METKKFTKNDSGFVCEGCGTVVKPLFYTSRNHCPVCLCSKHLDIFPGDRDANCGGVMDAVTVEISSKKGYIIIHKCRICGKIRRNKAADDDSRDAISDVMKKMF